MVPSDGTQGRVLLSQWPPYGQSEPSRDPLSSIQLELEGEEISGSGNLEKAMKSWSYWPPSIQKAVPSHGKNGRLQRWAAGVPRVLTEALKGARPNSSGTVPGLEKPLASQRVSCIFISPTDPPH